MADKDFAVNAVGMVVQHGVIAAGGQPGSQIMKKPTYLVLLEDLTGKTKVTKKFIALAKPDLLNGFIEMKGFFSDLDESKILENPAEVILNSPKENHCEMMFPWHRVLSIRNLIFNAIKHNTLTK
jgi:hypothetical protein